MNNFKEKKIEVDLVCYPSALAISEQVSIATAHRYIKKALTILNKGSNKTKITQSEWLKVRCEVLGI